MQQIHGGGDAIARAALGMGSKVGRFVFPGNWAVLLIPLSCQVHLSEGRGQISAREGE